MLVKILEDGSSIHIVFRHISQGDQKRTLCKIVRHVNGEDDQILSVGAAFCNPKDEYSKEKGRMLSMTRALAPFAKHLRTEAWAAYWNRGRNNEQEFIAAYVQDGENLSHDEAIQLAEERDHEAAAAFMASVSGADHA